MGVSVMTGYGLRLAPLGAQFYSFLKLLFILGRMFSCPTFYVLCVLYQSSLYLERPRIQTHQVYFYPFFSIINKQMDLEHFELSQDEICTKDEGLIRRFIYERVELYPEEVEALAELHTAPLDNDRDKLRFLYA